MLRRPAKDQLPISSVPPVMPPTAANRQSLKPAVNRARPFQMLASLPGSISLPHIEGDPVKPHGPAVGLSYIWSPAESRARCPR